MTRPLPPTEILDIVARLSLWIFVFSLPSEKAVEIPGLGTASRLFGAAALGAGLLAIAARRAFRIPSTFHLSMTFFVLWSATTYLWSIQPDWTLERIWTYAQLTVMAFLVWDLSPGEFHVNELLHAYVWGTAVPVFDTVRRYVVGTQTYYQRYATSGFDPNDLALTLALSIPVSYYLSLKSSNPARWLCRLQIVAVSAIILLTGSRGGMLTMLVGLSIVFTTWNLLPQAARLSHRSIAFLLALAVAIGVWLIPVSTWKRLGTLGTEVRQGTLNDRTVLWGGGWQAFRDVPLQGVGAGAYAEGLTPVLGRPRDFMPVAHNSFLSVLVETGLVGFLLFLTMFGTLMMAVRRMASLERRLWLTCLATWSLGVFALTWEHRKPTWLFFALLATHAGTLESSRVGRRKNAADRLPRPSWPVAEVA